MHAKGVTLQVSPKKGERERQIESIFNTEHKIPIWGFIPCFGCLRWSNYCPPVGDCIFPCKH